MSDQPPIRRRDFLITSALTAAGVGGAVALWPFIDSLNPAADTMARRVVIDIKPLTGTRKVTINVHQMPVVIFRRTEEELAALRNPTMPNKTRDPLLPIGYAFRDRDSEMPNQPDYAKNWHRSLRPEVMVCIGYCTHDPCIVSRLPELGENLLLCPCCGSHFDAAGRAYSGPARENLRVPPHRYIDDNTIEFIEADVNIQA